MFTFHPKLYIIDGETASVIVVGSSNLTRGGLFANYEAQISGSRRAASP